MGASVQIAAPLGQYDKDRLVNIGGNRWWVKREIGASRSFGKFDAELALAATIFTDNDDFLGQTREQDPIYSAQAHPPGPHPRCPLVNTTRSRFTLAPAS